MSRHLKDRGHTVTIESNGRVAMSRVDLHSSLKRIDRVADSSCNQNRKCRDAKSLCELIPKAVAVENIELYLVLIA